MTLEEYEAVLAEKRAGLNQTREAAFKADEKQVRAHAQLASQLAPSWHALLHTGVVQGMAGSRRVLVCFGARPSSTSLAARGCQCKPAHRAVLPSRHCLPAPQFQGMKTSKHLSPHLSTCSAHSSLFPCTPPLPFPLRSSRA